LLDFGAVKRVTTGEGTSSRSTGIYSVDFAPVEQIQGRKVYPSTDLYALAGTCIRLATGKPIQELHDSYNNRWIWRDYCEMSEQLAQILEKMLLPTPKQRFPSTQAVLNALQADSLCFQAGETSSIAISEKPAFSQPADWRLLLYPPSSQQLQDSDLSKDSQTDQSLLKNQTSSPEQGFPVEQATASKKGLPPVVYLMLIIILVSFAGNRLFTALNNSQQSPTISRKSESEGNPQTPSSETSPLSNRLSTGEKILIPSSLENYTFWEHKQKGTQAIAAGNYSQAVQHLEAALEEQRNSPETLIYLNNARIGEQDAFTIAVTVPIENDAVFFALEMLQGYAQAQQEINQAGGINGKPIKLMIADDDDDPKVAMEVAQALAAKEEILAVSGHWSSSTTLAVIPVYDENELVLVNPVSTSTKISGASEYVFRTIPSNFVVGATMANYALNYLNVEQVAIFYDSNSSYSLSLRQELKTSLSTRGGKVATEFDLSETGFLAKMRLQQAKDRNAEVIVLIPAPRTIDRALQVVNVNEGELPLIGDIGNLYGIKTLQVGGEDAVGMAFPIPWHVLKPGSPDFVQNSRQLWGGDVNWATVMTYDAMNAIAQALKQAPTREGIQDTLSRNDFSSPGVKETVKFLPSGDREGNLIMVEVQPANPSRSGTGYDFVPLNFN
jgi:branched-chain amino acid transport system substrate-binding protein